MKTRAGSLLSVPYPIEINYSPAQLTRRHMAVRFTEMVVDQCDEMVRHSEQRPLVCGLSLHTFIFGQPFRLAQLLRILGHIVQHPARERVWFARPGEIADHIEALPAGTVPGDQA